MSTIFTDKTCTVVRMRTHAPGVAYGVSRREALDSAATTININEISVDALLAILLDVAEKEDAKVETKASSSRVTMLKKLKSGNDGRGRGKAKPKGVGDPT